MPYKHMTQQEKDEVYLDCCSAFEDGIIKEDVFRVKLAQLGYNATDIVDIIKEHKPPIPEEG